MASQQRCEHEQNRRASSDDIAICERNAADCSLGISRSCFPPLRHSRSKGTSSFGCGGGAGSALFSAFLGGICSLSLLRLASKGIYIWRHSCNAQSTQYA